MDGWFTSGIPTIPVWEPKGVFFTHFTSWASFMGWMDGLLLLLLFLHLLLHEPPFVGLGLHTHFLHHHLHLLHIPTVRPHLNLNGACRWRLGFWDNFYFLIALYIVLCYLQRLALMELPLPHMCFWLTCADTDARSLWCHKAGWLSTRVHSPS